MQQARMFITNSMKANGTNLDDFIKLGAFAESSLKRRINYSHVVKAAILMGIASEKDNTDKPNPMLLTVVAMLGAVAKQMRKGT